MKYKKTQTFYLIASLLALSFACGAGVPDQPPADQIDCLAEFIRISKPENYDPAQNALPYYHKAIRAFHHLPEDVPETINRKPRFSWRIIETWPGELDSDTTAFMKNWLDSNARALQFVRSGSTKPYLWFDSLAENNDFQSVRFPELNDLRSFARAISFRAKLHVLQRAPDKAVKDLDIALNMARQLQGSKTDAEQMTGIVIRSIAVDAAFTLLDRTELQTDMLKKLQLLFFSHEQQLLPFNFAANKLSLYESTQNTYRGLSDCTVTAILNKQMMQRKGGEAAKDQSLRDRIVDTLIDRELQKVLYPGAVAEDRQTTFLRIDRCFRMAQGLMHRSPWQMQSQGTTYTDEVQSHAGKNIVLWDVSGLVTAYITLWQQDRLNLSALSTTIAIHRYYIEKGQLPGTLMEVVAANYLNTLPMDAYSDGPLIYRTTKSGFTLYSVGADFTDDGGKHGGWAGEENGDCVFWPVQKAALN